MLKVIKPIFAFTFVASILACGGAGNPKSVAKDLCNCMKDVGIEELKGASPREVEDIMEDEIARNIAKDGPECFINIMDDVVEEMEDMNKEQRANYIKKLLKAGLDTECSDIFLSIIPYDEMMEQMERNLGRKSEGERKSFGGPDICDCINMDYDDEEMREACEELGDRIEDDYSQEEIMEMVEECM